jgi:DNA modification methylase
VVALQNGRHYTGIELNPEYHALSIKELAAAELSLSAEEMEAGQLSLLEDLTV